MTSAQSGGAVLLNVRGARPIPINHRIEVRVFYSAGGSGLFGMGSPEPQYESPLITDLETGITYGSLEYFHPPFSVYTAGQVFPATHTLLPGLQEHSRWFGKVMVCNVLHTGRERNEIQTTLLIEPIAPPHPGYR